MATISERDSALTISRWLERVEQEQELAAIALTTGERTCRLPEMMRSIALRGRETVARRSCARRIAIPAGIFGADAGAGIQNLASLRI